MSPVYHIDFDFDTEALLNEATALFEGSGYNSEYKGFATENIENFKLIQEDWGNSPVARAERERFLRHYGIWDESYDYSNSRYMKLDANTMLLPHADNHACCINHILNGHNVPINFYGEEYLYTTALLDVSQTHGVNNMGNPDRMILKIAFYEDTFEEIKQALMK